MRTALAALGLAALLYAGARSVGPAPPMGSFLDPAGGAWAVARTADLPARATADVPGLGAEVRVLYDTRGVPHIFAASEDDARRALGFVVARDRLFQLELQARAGGGELTRLFGARALDADRDTRRLGLAWSARRKLDALGPDSPYGRAVRAYADGVNAYLATAGAADVPLEYRLVNARPMRRWEPLQSFHLFGRMGQTLAFDDAELDLALAEARVGRAAAAALFARNSPIQEPIQPNGRRAPRFDAVRLPPPGPPDSSRLVALLALGRGGARAGAADPLDPAERVAIGSNNWAVTAARTRDHHALLAGDPHLDLTLPSIWYEVHLVVPGRLDVYGVTIPGAPSILIGFNRDVAWSFTNTQADVFDRYVETVDDAVRPTRYRLDGDWRPLARHVEEYLGPGGAVIARDTLLLTHRGPMVRLDDGRWVSQRWTVNDSDAVGGEFDALAHAHGVEEGLANFAPYAAPAQNLMIADRAGRIA
ncbi:MAG TPA: penicillin acylase family protein, partial [Gemmatimonadaceae bacterium]|nr:penicillin acylase family protein [Gemmatimonadaceae bacterium]